jgi:hypothetical protein
MLKNNAVIQDAPAMPALSSGILADIKKEEMKQAIVERFSIRLEVGVRTAVSPAGRSPYWQAADEEC